MPTDKVTVIGGTYNLAVNTSDNSLNGSLIKFFLVDKGDPTNPNKALEAETPSVSSLLGNPDEVHLVFPAIAPTPTPTPEPTATPVPPTRQPQTSYGDTGTADTGANVHVPKPTATPVPPTATPVPPTATSSSGADRQLRYHRQRLNSTVNA